MKIQLLFSFLLSFSLLFGQSSIVKFNPIAIFPGGVPLNVHTYWGYEHRFSYRSSVEVGVSATWGTAFWVSDAGSSRMWSSNLKYRYYFRLKDSLIQKGFYAGGMFRFQKRVEYCGFWCMGQSQISIWGVGAMIGKNTKIGQWGLLDVRLGVIGALADSEGSIANYDGVGDYEPMTYFHHTYFLPQLTVDAHWGIALGKKYRKIK